MKKEKDLSVIIVNYNTKNLLKNCLHSIYKNTKKISFDIFVVDNNSSDRSSEIVKKEFPKVNLIVNKTNPGFAAANNQAIKKTNSRYVLLLNPDTLILNDALNKMIEFMDKTENCGAAGTLLLNEDKTIQNSIHYFPSLIRRLSEAFYFHRIFPKSKSFNEECYDAKEYSYAHEVDWITGASLIVNKKAIEKAGLLDESFFMYSEESDWCRRLRKAGFSIWFNPEAKIIHYGGQSGKSKINADLMKSKMIHYAKYNNKLKSELFNSLIWVHLLFHASIIFIFNLISGNSAREKYLNYLQAIKDLKKG